MIMYNTWIGMYFCQWRLELAALHFNENCNREQAITKEGIEQYDIVFPKYKKGGYIVKKVVKKPTYSELTYFMYSYTIIIII